MKSDRTQRRPNIILCVAAALLAIAPASIVRAADGGDSLRIGGASDPAGQHLQLGVGQSVIVDLPEEAGEIYVGDPNVANAIVRSAKRVYISGVANGQTSIFALARDGRRIAVFQVSVGRDVAELSNLLNTAIPGNEIHVRTVENTIILTGSVASAEEAQKALDIADGFVNDSASAILGQLRSRSRAARAPAAAGGALRRLRAASPASARGRVINALTIRGADQVSLRVTVAEIRRDIIKQLGVNLSGSGPNGSFTLDNPFAINGAVAASEGSSELGQGQPKLQRHSAGLRATGRRPHARRADRDRGVRRNRQIPGRRHDSHPQQRAVQSRLPVRIHPAALWRDPEFYAGRLVPGTDPTANRDRSHRYRPFDASHFQRHCNPGFPDPQQHDDGRAALRRLDRLRRPHQHADGAGDQRLSGADEPAGARRAVSLAGLSAQRDRAVDHRDALHRARDRSRARSSGPTRISRTPAIRRAGSLAASTGSTPRRSRSSRCLAIPARSDSSPSRPCVLRQKSPQT